MLCWINIAKFLTIGTSGSNEILLGAWLRPNIFYFLGIVSTYITRNLAGISVIVLSHAGQQHPRFYLNLIHMPLQSGSICDNLLPVGVLLGSGSPCAGG